MIGASTGTTTVTDADGEATIQINQPGTTILKAEKADSGDIEYVPASKTVLVADP